MGGDTQSSVVILAIKVLYLRKREQLTRCKSHSSERRERCSLSTLPETNSRQGSFGDPFSSRRGCDKGAQAARQAQMDDCRETAIALGTGFSSSAALASDCTATAMLGHASSAEAIHQTSISWAINYGP